MRDLDSTFRAVAFIEAHLQDDITVADMAHAAGYSLYHFIRAFNQDSLYTPYDYLMRRRLSQSASDLLNSRARVIDIALRYRFNNHETFSRAFKRLFGLQPIQWRERGLIPHRALTPPLILPYLEHIHSPAFQRPQLIDLPPRCLVGLMTPLPADMAPLQQGLARLLSAAGAASIENGIWKVISYPEHPPAFCLLGVLAPTAQPAAPPLVTLNLPPGRYLHMPHAGPAAHLSLTLDYLYHTWLPKTRHKVACPFEIEIIDPADPSQVELLLDCV